MTIFGMTRVKNEGRWIEQVLRSWLPLCERIFLLDDSSKDFTVEIAERLDERMTVIRSLFTGVDETRDKSYLLDRVMGCVSDVHLRGNEKSPFWCLALDGDEILESAGPEIIRCQLAETKSHALKLPIKYCWNDRETIRTDGVYQNFARPSIFRLFNREFKFQSTPFGGNFHCSSIPQQLLHHAHETCSARIWHLGYMDPKDRARKVAWYNKIDPHNKAEDEYAHCWQGDKGGPPADAKLKHAGPLRLEKITI